MSHTSTTRSPVVAFLFENSLFLVFGALAALLWANFDDHSYQRFVSFDIQSIWQEEHAEHDEHGSVAVPDAEHETEGGAASDHGEGHGHSVTTVQFLVNDILMALFFAIAAKEVWESLLPGGALSNVRKAATPLLATAGGVLGPALIYLLGAGLSGQSGMFGQSGDLGRGWAIPCATDIAFSYLVARLIFGPGHPAIAFLLLLAIADDAAGLIILAIFYPTAPIALPWLGLTVGAMAIGFLMQRWKVYNFWYYLLIPGTLSWFSFYMANIHPALGLVPIIPCMPHAHTDLGIFAREELNRLDTLNAFEHWWKNPVQIILGLFGLVNAGVVLSSIGTGTYLVLAGLLIGKPVGITALTWFAERVLRLEIPEGMSYRHIVSLGMVAAIGFTVALFVATAAYPVPGPTQDAVKMGALLSFLAAVLSFVLARMLGVRPEPIRSPAAESSTGAAHPGDLAYSSTE